MSVGTICWIAIGLIAAYNLYRVIKKNCCGKRKTGNPDPKPPKKTGNPDPKPPKK